MIELKNVTKKYKNNTALLDFNYCFQKNKCYGILGINGAGKTTLINAITKNISINGEVIFDDLNIWDIGYVPQELAFYPELSVVDNMKFFASLYKMNNNKSREIISTLIDIVGLTEKTNEKSKDLSGGMKRKLNLITALISNPKILICDEICVGIDPISRQEILNYLLSLKQNGLTIIYTSHYLDEVEFLCDEIIFIDSGKLILSGDKKDLLNHLSNETHKETHLSDLFMQVLRKDNAYE